MNVLRRYLASPSLYRMRESVRGVLGACEGVRVRVERALRKDQTMVPGLVSVIVPAYEVEDYIEETLHSLMRQNYRRVEIIVVDDGSPDNVARVTRRIARIDPRIRLIRQENRGLSGARNTGARAARGEFITFIDSDDTVDRHIFTNAVNSLNDTGSDFAVYPYRRYFKSQYPAAAYWIGEAHEEYRGGVQLEDFPQIMVNAVAWSKLYRRSFWEDNSFEFPEGLLYEDQAVSCRAYALAKGFDVLPIVSINWRIREDQSSISQKLAEPRNIRDHAIAVRQSIEVLAEAGLPEVAEQRLAQVLSYNLGEFVAILGTLSEEAWTELVSFLRYLRSALSDEAWERVVPTRSKIVVRLVLDGQQDQLMQFLALGGWANDRLPFQFRRGKIVPELDDFLPEHTREEEEFVRSEEETRLRTSVVRIREQPNRDISVEVDFFVPSLDPASIDEVSVTLHGDGLSDASVSQVPVAVAALGSELSVLPGNYWEVRRGSVNLPASLLEYLDEDRDYSLSMSVRAGALVRTNVVQGSREKGPLGAYPAGASTSYIDAFVEPLSRGLTFRKRSTPSVEIVETSFTPTELVFQARTTAQIQRVLVLRNDQFVLDRGRTVAHRQSADGTLRIGVPLSLLRTSSLSWAQLRVLCVDSRGEIAHARVARPTSSIFDGESAVSVSFQISPDRLRLRTYREGSERVMIPAGAALIATSPRALIDSYECDETGITFFSSRHNLDLSRNGEDEDWRFFAEGTGRSLDGAITADGSTLRMHIPFAGNAWGQPNTAVEPGSYTLRLDRDGVGYSVGFSQTVVTQWAPLLLRRPDMNLEVKRSARGYAELVVRPPLAEGDGGANGFRIKNWYAPKRNLPRKKQILFRSLYGEVANDSSLAVFSELQRRDSPLELIWSVRDRSVAVPEGSSVVIDGTRDFFEAYAESEYLMVNVHQADWSQKPVDQKIIQTFHGYPFKLAGRRWWAELGFSAARVESYLRRALEWDYLVSPAPYATPHLREFLPQDRPFPGQLLEIGYPRNDVLLSKDSSSVRQSTRDRLGIPQDAKVLLYGPTFRDYLSADDMSAKLVDFLDVEEVAEALGDEWVILLRGHPFNARHGVRSNTHVLNVTYYPEINDLILASDVGLLDYSSLRFDYALTDKPMLFLTPDRERYFSGRESFEPYADTSPGPHLMNTREVIEALRSIEEVGAKYAPARAEFRARYMPLEDGQAARRLVDSVFLPRGDAGAA